MWPYLKNTDSDICGWFIIVENIVLTISRLVHRSYYEEKIYLKNNEEKIIVISESEIFQVYNCHKKSIYFLLELIKKFRNSSKLSNFQQTYECASLLIIR